jgi:hypothetical protein
MVLAVCADLKGEVMKKLIMGLLMCIVLSSNICCAEDSTISDTQLLNEYFKIGKQVILRKTLNNCRQVYVYLNNNEYYYEYGESRFFPLRDNEAVNIKKIDFKEDFLTVEFENDRLGRGKINYFNKDQEKLSKGQLAFLLRRSFVFKDDNFIPYYGNKESKILHINGCNHLFFTDSIKEFRTKEEAFAEGFQECNICFRKVYYISGYEIENELKREVAAKIRYYYPFVIDESKQKQMQEIGRKILNNWPVPLKGYDYNFYVIQSEYPNAVACPGGEIFISNNLLYSLESDTELEAILAHEIAHVEQRHGYRQLRSAQDAALVAAFWGALAGVAVTAATKSSSAGKSTMELVVIMSEVGTEIALAGYSRDYEKEADGFSLAYLFSQYGNEGKNRLCQVLSKLKYQNNIMGIMNDKKSIFASHPNIDERINIMKGMTTAVLKVNKYDYIENERIVFSFKPELQNTFEIESSDNYGNKTLNSKTYLYCTLKATDNLEVKIKISSIDVKTNSEEIRLNNKEKIEIFPNDETGLIFESDRFIDLSNQKIQSIKVNIEKKGYTENIILK